MHVSLRARGDVHVPVDGAEVARGSFQPVRRALLEWQQLPSVGAELHFERLQVIVKKGQGAESLRTAVAIWQAAHEDIPRVRLTLRRHVQHVLIAPVSPVQRIIHPRPISG